MNLSAFLIGFHTMMTAKLKYRYIPITSDTTYLRATYTVSHRTAQTDISVGAIVDTSHAKFAKHQKLLHYLFACACVGFAVHITPAAQPRTQPDNVFCKDCVCLCVFLFSFCYSPKSPAVSLLMCRTLFVIHV